MHNADDIKDALKLVEDFREICVKRITDYLIQTYQIEKESAVSTLVPILPVQADVHRTSVPGLHFHHREVWFHCSAENIQEREGRNRIRSEVI